MSCQPPRPVKKPQTQTLHGVQRTDPYTWLRAERWQEIINNPEALNADIRKHLETENRYTAVMMQDQQQQVKKLFAEMKARIKQDERSAPEHDGDFVYYRRYRKAQQYPIFCRQPASTTGNTSAAEHVLFDCNPLASTLAYFKHGQCQHSPNHRFFAYAF